MENGVSNSIWCQTYQPLPGFLCLNGWTRWFPKIRSGLGDCRYRQWAYGSTQLNCALALSPVIIKESKQATLRNKKNPESW